MEIRAWSNGGKCRLSPTARVILDGKIATRLPATPPLNLPYTQSHCFCSRLICQIRPLMQKKHETKALDNLNSNCPPTNGDERLLHEIVGKITTRRTWPWHSGFLSFPGLLSGVKLLLPEVWINHDVICETDH
jgi:hypothetical protein